ncbi:hypothetical protein RRG08_058285 [Elysia crispata]|uniref:Uncharacterized protein n=1 Tax=Elysia crispata TaxID=231223 RepID=A0AAE0YWJ5_9GAST|nr:hypothetical protein RRG08_058285 [Elysia crispata]
MMFRLKQADIRAGKRCTLFSNIYTGLNERHLTFISKEWSFYLLVVGENKTAKYSGFLEEVANALSVSMNFTYTFFPGPVESKSISWRTLENMVISDGVGDVAFSLYYTSASLVYNMSSTYPIFITDMIGAYVSEPHVTVQIFTSKLSSIFLFVRE